VCSDCKAIAKREIGRRRKIKYGRNHRQRARHHGVRYVPVPVKAIYERDNYTCQICSKKCLPKAIFSKATGKIHPQSPSIDHIVPMCRGGDHVESNLQTACFKCNSLKSSKGGGQLRLGLT
jgi:5-methylcytosine-specific restriction endonuclease McrA